MYKCTKFIKKIGYNFCKKQNKKIVYSDCVNCTSFEKKTSKEYKYTKNNKRSPSSLKKGLKKVSKKREFVSKETYEKTMKKCKNRCVLCYAINNLQLHHINGRGKGKTDNPNNCVILCNYCHLEIVHKNNKYWRKKLKEMEDKKLY